MSLDEIREDLKRNMRDVRSVLDENTRNHLANTLWPFLEALIEEVAEIDDAVAELVDQQEDYLQPGTAAVFAAVIQSSLQLLGQLKPLVPNDNTELLQQITAYEQLCGQAVEVLGAVTVTAGDDDEEDEDDDEDEAEETGNE